MNTTLLAVIDPPAFWRAAGTVFAVLLVLGAVLYVSAYFLINRFILRDGRQRIQSAWHGILLDLRKLLGSTIFFFIFSFAALVVLHLVVPGRSSGDPGWALLTAGALGFLGTCGLWVFWDFMEGMSARGGGAGQTIERGREVGTMAEAQRMVDREAGRRGQLGGSGRRGIFSWLAGWFLGRR